MIAHSKSVRSLKVTPRTVAQHVVDATYHLPQVSAQVMRCTAKVTFTKGNVVVQSGQAYFLVQSGKFEHRFYVVSWNVERSCWQCSCGSNCKSHEHIKRVNEYIRINVRKEAA